MITFKNITGNKFLAVGTIQRKSALNGEKSLTGTLYDGDDVLNKIDKGWSLEFDNEPYIVTYFERNDNDNSVSFDAIHNFFWDMAKNVLYSETSGSHTIKWYLDQIFADAGYTYALNFNPNAIAKDNWGMKNKLSLFNDIITSIEGEFEINGTLVSIFKNIGTDLSTIVRYGFNLSDMTIENDASGFVTYGEGFGAYADQENMTGDRLHVTYTSPLASVYGKLQAEPIDDQRYTIESNLLDAVKSQVDGSFSISVNLSLYDLSVAGYPYKMANVGDWLTAVDENLDFKQRIRIISIDDAFAADGTRISYSVTAGDIGLTKKYQDANASIANKVENAVISAGQAATDANIALIAANGKNKSYYLNDINDLPKTANEGDLAWVQSGDGRVLYIYTKKADGTYYWEKRIDPEMGEQIEAGVNEAIAQANENTATAIEENNISQQEVMNDIAKSQADLAIKDGDFNNKAQAMADEALANAKANTATVAQETLNTANENLDAAKKTLTTDLQKEVSDRTSAVTALDTKAQGYVNAAKTDVLETVNKEVTDRQNAVSALDTKATNAVNQAKSDINATINALSVGGRNYLLNSNGSTLSLWTPVSGWQVVSDSTRGNVFSFTPTATWTGGSTNSISQSRTDFTTGKNVTVSFWAKASVDGAKFHSEPTGGNAAENSSFNITLTTTWKRYSYTFVLKTNRVYFMPVDAGTIYYLDDLQLETGNMLSDYKQAPEDVVLDYTTKDSEIKTTISQYQTTNDGKVSKAQTDATIALGQVATKVSQTDYDTKTGDLTTKYTQVKQTADSQAADIVDIKATATSQASKINSISSDVDGTKQSISDIETTQDSQSDKINQITTDVNGTKQSITDIQTKDGQQDTRMGTIETSVSGVKSDFSSYKTTNDGALQTVQTTAQTAVDGLKTKVSQTDYNTKTGQLQTDLTSTTQTANQAKTDIVSIKQTDTSQDSRMNTIESDASGTKQTVSNIQTKQGEQSASITSLQTRSDGIEADVTELKRKANKQGQVNQLFNTEFSPDFAGWYTAYPNATADNVVKTELVNVGTDGFGSNVVSHKNVGAWIASQSIAVKAGMSVSISSRVSAPAPISSGVPIAIYVMAYNDSNERLLSVGYNVPIDQITTTPTVFKKENIVMPDGVTKVVFVYGWNVADEVYLSQPMMVFDSTVGDYVQGTYSNSLATAKAQLTADTARTEISNYKTDADGRISKAQSDITQTATQVATKVSQSDYNAKTSELTTKVSTAQQTADSAVTTIGSYKTSNDNRVAAAETKISQNANDITLRATTSDLNAAKSDYTAKIAQVKVDAQAVTTTVSQIQTTVNKLNQNNLVNNSQLNPDYSGWHVISPWGKSVTNELTNNGVESNSGAMWVWHDQSKTGEWIYSDPINILQGSTLSASIMAAMPTPPSSGTPLALYVRTYDANKTIVDSWVLNITYNMVNGTFKKFSLDNKIVSSGAKYASVVFGWNVAGMISFGKPMLVFGTTTGDYVAGPYNNNDKIASQQITIDGITSIVSDPTTGLSTRVQTAEGTLNTVKSTAEGAMSKASQTANDITQEIKDRGNGDSNTLQSSKDFTQSSITSAVNGVNSTITQTANGILASVSASNLVVNSEFDPLDKFWYTMGGVGSAVTGLFTWPTTNKYGDWAVVSGSRTVEYGVASSISSELKPASPLTAYSASILAGRSAVPSSSVAIDFRIAFWDSSRQLLSMSSSGNIIDGATSKSIALYKNENKISPLGTAYVSVCIAHSSNLVAETLSRPMLNVGATVSPYSATRGTDSSGVILSLFKDNWSIGITDNIGKITSGIVGDTGSMSLISKNITLDGNTTVTGDFYAKGGNFKNLNASNMTVGTLNGSQVNITNVNAANITGDITNFIQSNWNGVYGSTTITSSGMTIVSPGTVALFNVNGMTLDGAGGMTRVANGFTQIYSATHENIGMIGHQKDVDHDNVDYITFGLNGYRTTNEGDSHWVGGSDFYGGDGMGFGVSNKKGTYDLKLRWDSDLIAGYKGEIQGWHANDAFIFDDKTYHKGYADFSGGVTMSGAYSEGTRSLHTQGMSISTGAKWFGFMDSSNSTGFGTDQTNDVLFYVKGQVYSLYTMLGKLGMR